MSTNTDSILTLSELNVEFSTRFGTFPFKNDLYFQTTDPKGDPLEVFSTSATGFFLSANSFDDFTGPERASSLARFESRFTIAPITAQLPDTIAYPVVFSATVQGQLDDEEFVKYQVISDDGLLNPGNDAKAVRFLETGNGAAFNMFASVDARLGAFRTLSVTDITASIDPSVAVLVDGVSVPLANIVVLAPDTVPVSADVYPKLPSSIDGFNFDPGQFLNVDGGTVTAKGIDEDGFGGNFRNVVQNLTLNIDPGAQVLTIEDRPSRFSDSRGDAAIDVLGDGNSVKNDGTIVTEKDSLEGVSLKGDGNTVTNTATGVIAAAGDDVRAVVLEGNGNRVSNLYDGVAGGLDDDDVDTGNVVPKIGGFIGASGEGAVGVLLVGARALDSEYSAGTELELRNVGVVAATGTVSSAVFFDAASGASAGGEANLIDNNGLILNTGTSFAGGIVAGREAVSITNNENATIRTTGTKSPAVLMGGTQMDLLNAGTVMALGRLSPAVMALGTQTKIVNELEGVIASTAPSNAIALQIGGFQDGDFNLLNPQFESLNQDLASGTEAQDPIPAAQYRETANQVTLRNSGLIEAAGDSSTLAIVAHIEDSTIQNQKEGTISGAETAILISGTANLSNAGQIVSRVHETDPTANVNTIIVDRIGSEVVIDNQAGGVISGRVAFVYPKITVINDGDIGGILFNASDMNAIGGQSEDQSGRLRIEHAETGRIGLDPSLRSVEFIALSDDNTIDIQSSGDFTGGLWLAGDGARMDLSFAATTEIAAQNVGLRLGGPASAKVQLDGDIKVTDGTSGLLFENGPDPDTVISMDLTIGGTGSIEVAGQESIAINARLIDGSLILNNAGAIRASESGAKAVAALQVAQATETLELTNSGQIGADGTGAIAVETRNATVTNSGTVAATGTNASALLALSGVEVINSGTISAGLDATAAIWTGGADGLSTEQFLGGSDIALDIINTGTISASDATSNAILGATTTPGNDRIVNSGTITGIVDLAQGFDVFVQNQGIVDGKVRSSGSSGTVEARAGDIDGAIFEGFARLDVRGAARLVGTLDIDRTDVKSGAVATLGEGTLISNVTVADGGRLTGTGRVQGNVTIEPGGIFDPGNSPGTVNVEGNATIKGKLMLDLEGTDPGSFDQLLVSGALDLSQAEIELLLGDAVTPEALKDVDFFAANTLIGADQVEITVANAPDVAVALTENGQIAVNGEVGAPPNGPPVATADLVTAPQDKARAISSADLLANDTDPDGDALVLSAVSGSVNGTATLTQTGDVTFTPASGFTGDARFEYTVSDGQDGTATGQVTVKVNATFAGRARDAVGPAPTDLGQIRDFDGNDLGAAGDWKLIGAVDIQFDGDAEFIYVNPQIARWATVGPDGGGAIDFADHGEGGETRVVGIYIDPEVEKGNTERFSEFDSQQRFQNDLAIDNLTVIDAFDFDRDSFQEIYFKVNDGTAYLRALMHADGNIQYANYQSTAQVEAYLTSQGFGQEVLETILV